MKKVFPVLLMSLLVLSGCKDEELEERRVARIDYEILDFYDYDRVKVVVEDEKTAEELANEKLREKVGLTDTSDYSYPEVGIASSQGIFVETAIADGPVLPTLHGFSIQDADLINNTGIVEWESRLQESYDKLIGTRQQDLEVLQENFDSQADLIAEIEREAEEQRKRIEEQKKAKEEQELEQENSVEDEEDTEFD